jgi:Rod binding domain-containing protein
MGDTRIPTSGKAFGNALATRLPAAGGSAQAANRAYQDFEATLVSTMLESALPKGKATFGKGLPGEMARSELARQLGAAVASHGSLGIARQVSGAGKK